MMKPASRPRPRSSYWSYKSLLLVVVLCACSEPGAVQPQAARVQQPIAQGAADTSETYPAVVALVGVGGTTSACSGILITPFWVMSASHCFNGSPWSTTSNFDVIVGSHDPAQAPATSRFKHRVGVSGEVLTRGYVPDTLPSDNEISHDVVVFRLDSRVPRSLAKPILPTLTVNSCPESNFVGTLVGFGDTYEANTDPGGVCGDEDNIRRSSIVSGWDRHDRDDGTMYSHVWPMVFQGVCAYDGNVQGDSGGAFLDPTGRLCGVISAIRPFPLFGFSAWRYEAFEAGVDSAETIQFLTSAKTTQGFGVIDSKGNFDGLCPAYVAACDQFGASTCTQLENTDVDGDGVMDICDNCPKVWNPEQIVTNDDPDGNGKGAVCDQCPGEFYIPGPIMDCNYEVSVASEWPNLVNPPLIGPPMTPTQIATEAAKLRNSIIPNRCDPVACPQHRHATSDPGMSDSLLPPVVDCDSNNQPLNCNCDPVAPGWTCAWWVRTGKLELRPRTQPGVGEPDGTAAKIGMRFCECDPADYVSTPQSRLACRQECPMTAEAYGSSPSWRQIKAAASPTGPFLTGEEISTTLEEFGDNNVQAGRYWDIRPLAESGYGTVTHMLNDPTRAITSWRVHGITMAKVVQVQDQNVSATSRPDFYERSMTFAGAHLAIELTDVDPLAWVEGITAGSWWFAHYCPTCPLGFTFVGKEVSNPVAIAGLGMVEPASSLAAVPDSLATVLDEAIGSQLQIVLPSETPAIIAAYGGVAGSSMLRGVAFDMEFGYVAYTLESEDIWSFPSASTREPAGESPQIQGDEGFALSSTLRTLIMVGGEEGESAWMLDVDTNEWQELPHGDEQYEILPGAVLGTAFRLADYRVWIAALHEGQPYLWRYSPREAMQVVAALPEFWQGYERSWLAIGEGLQVVFAASNHVESLVALFTVIPESDTLAFSGALRLGGVTFKAAPIVDGDSIITVVGEEQEMHVERISFEQLETPPVSERPEIY